MSGPVTLDDPAPYFARLDAFETLHWWPKAMRRIALGWIEGALGHRTGLSGIDIGCGNGRMVKALAELRSIDSVIGLEPASEALARAKRGIFVQGSALQLPFRDDSADLMTCLDVFQHLPDGGDLKALGEMFRVLRPRGLFLIRANAGGQGGYRLRGLCSKVVAAGFRIERASYVNSLPALAQEVRGRLVRSRPHPEGGGLPEASPKGWGSRLMGSVATIEAEASVRLKLNLPFGHGTMILARRD